MNKETDKGPFLESMKAVSRIRRMMEPMSSLLWFIDSKQKLMPTIPNPLEQVEEMNKAIREHDIRQAKAKEAEKQAAIDWQQQVRDEDKKIRYFHIAISAFAIFFVALVPFLITTIVTTNLDYLIALAALGPFIILSSIAVFIYWPGRTQSMRSWFVRFGKRIWRIVKRA